MRLPARPAIYEINTAVWLTRLGNGRGTTLALDEVPAEYWDALASLPVDAVWLMGVWLRSPAGLEIALGNPDLNEANRQALPDLKNEDVIGSPYCVREYVVDPRFGGPDALARAREELSRRGLGLILDYVPNHVAPDHRWLSERPNCFLHGSEQDLVEHPEAFVRTAGGIVANGRDPYFAPWPDVVQLNAFSPELREAVASMLIGVCAQCDGLRCDMAMLMTTNVFARTWGDRAGTPPEAEFWPTLIEKVRVKHPDVRFIAETYWDMEWDLQQQGFDFCYDKRLYDRLVNETAESVRGHLRADDAYQERLVRFIENHDEPRAAATFGPAKARAAAVVMSTIQGARLYHDGQFEGARTRIPVFLDRGPEEATDTELRRFYEQLLAAVAASGLPAGDWHLCETSGWADNDSNNNLVCWCWSTDDSRHLVVVNLSNSAAQGHVRLPWSDMHGRPWNLSDLLSGQKFERDGDELSAAGLYVALDGWASHFLYLASDRR